MNLANLYKKQISLTEWFADIDHKDTESFRNEDNWKRKRMEELSFIIPFPFDKPTSFDATDVVDTSEVFQEFLDEHGDELCALRLIPKQDGLPKLRMRGMTVKDAVSSWLPEQGIDPTLYQADVVPHPSDHIWSTIFVVTSKGIIGEIIRGGHNQLTQGFHDDNVEPIRFRFDYNTLETDTKDEKAEMHLREIFSYLQVKDEMKRQHIAQSFDIAFHGEWLPGYFETVSSTDHGLWFIDWNRVLGNMYEDFWAPISVQTKTSEDFLSGTVGCSGSATGIVRVVHPTDVVTAEFNQGDILVCLMTSPDYVPLMKCAGAVLTQEGGILSHAAIVSREMGVPCIVGVSRVLDMLSSGDHVEVDANIGIVRKIEK